MTYRVTMSLGRSTLDPAELDAEGAKLRAALPAGHEILVDPVKATLQVTMASRQASALEAGATSIQQLYQAFKSAGLSMPSTIVTLESESVPESAEPAPQPHAVRTGG